MGAPIVRLQLFLHDRLRNELLGHSPAKCHCAVPALLLLHDRQRGLSASALRQGRLVVLPQRQYGAVGRVHTLPGRYHQRRRGLQQLLPLRKRRAVPLRCRLLLPSTPHVRGWRSADAVRGQLLGVPRGQGQRLVHRKVLLDLRRLRCGVLLEHRGPVRVHALPRELVHRLHGPRQLVLLHCVHGRQDQPRGVGHMHVVLLAAPGGPVGGAAPRAQQGDGPGLTLTRAKLNAHRHTDLLGGVAPGIGSPGRQ